MADQDHPAEPTVAAAPVAPRARRRLLPRSVWLKLLGVLTLVVIMAVPLARQGSRFSEKYWFPDGQSPSLSLAMPFTPQVDGSMGFILPVTVGPGPNPGAVESVNLLFGTYQARPELIAATLVGANGRCSLSADRWEILEDNRYLRFTPAPSCELAAGDTLTLNVRARKLEGLALFSVKPPVADPKAPLPPAPVKVIGPNVLTAKGPDGGQVTLFASGQAQWEHPGDALTAARRFDLLAAMWGPLDSPGRLWLGSRLAVGLGLIALGALLLLGFGRWLWWRGLQTCVGAALLFAGLGVYEATVTPPFEAPDEATHYLTYRDVTGLPSRVAEALLLANRGDYARVMCKTDQCFATEDIAHPEQAPFPGHVGRTDMASRSALGYDLWQVYGKVLPDQPVADGLWTLRCLNALLLGLVVGLSLGLTLWSWRRDLSRERLVFLCALFLAPTLPNFGMHVSNHSLILAGYLMALAAGVAILLDGANSLRCLVGGAAVAVMALGGQTGVFGSVSIVVAALVLGLGRLLLPRERSRAALILTTLLYTVLTAVAAVAVVLPFYSSLYVHRIANTFRDRYVAIQPSLTPLVWVGIAGSLLAGVVLVVGLFVFVRRWRWSTLWIRVVGLVVIIVTAFLIYLPQIRLLPAVPDVEYGSWDHNTLHFMKIVLRSYLGNLGFGGRDFFVFWSFWGGFGCPDRTFPDVVIQALKLTVLGGWCAFGWSCFLRPFGERVWQLAALTLGAFTWLMILAYAASSGSYAVNFHGRYSIGFHLMTIVCAGLGYRYLLSDIATRFRKRDPRVAPWWTTALAVGVVMLTHGLGLWWHMARFFG